MNLREAIEEAVMRADSSWDNTGYVSTYDLRNILAMHSD
jgi:hypothetical protein